MGRLTHPAMPAKPTHRGGRVSLGYSCWIFGKTLLAKEIPLLVKPPLTSFAVLSRSSIFPFFNFVLMWSFTSLLLSVYTLLQLWVSLHEPVKAAGGQTHPEAGHILGNLASRKSYLLPSSVKAVQNP